MLVIIFFALLKLIVCPNTPYIFIYSFSKYFIFSPTNGPTESPSTFFVPIHSIITLEYMWLKSLTPTSNSLINL